MSNQFIVKSIDKVTICLFVSNTNTNGTTLPVSQLEQSGALAPLKFYLCHNFSFKRNYVLKLLPTHLFAHCHKIFRFFFLTASLMHYCIGCQTGWIPFEKKCYKYFDTKISWKEAEKICGHLSGELAVPSTAGKNDFISTKFTLDPIWVGGFKNLTSGDWEWIDGSVWSYTKWSPTYAQQPSGDGNFINSNHNVKQNNGPGFWNDEPGNSHLNFLCQTTKKGKKGYLTDQIRM